MTTDRATDNQGADAPGPRLTATDLAARLAAICPQRHLDLAGAVALPCPLPHADRWRAAVREDRLGGLAYLERDAEARLDPTGRHRWATTLLVFAQRYTDGWPAGDPDPTAGGPPGAAATPPWTARVARYARGLDYHDVLRADLEAVVAALREDLAGVAGAPFSARVAVDTGPYLEREYGWLAGLGFLGRNTCLIHEKLGSGLCLGVALTNLVVDGLPPPGQAAPEPMYAAAPRRRHAVPVAPATRCGSCTACLEACPTGALLPGGGMDAGRCLSTWTIEWRGQVPPGREAEAGGLLFGCDICQAVCPWNRHAAAHPADGLAPPRAEYAPLPAHAELTLADLATLPDEVFAARLRRTPLWRAHPEGLRRNAARVLAQVGAAVPPAAWWRPLPNGQVACDLCPVGCRLRPGQNGPCGTRANRGGVMVPLHWGRVATTALDPIEKKPLYHFHPGRDILSIAAPGCNLHCGFCQNWTLSQRHDAPTREAAPADLVAAARREGAVGLAFTYSEPLVWFEFVRDTARLAKAAGLAVVLVTNGYLNPAPLDELLPLVDAANIDLKSLDDRFYRRLCKARLEPVLESIRRFVAAGVHVELTNLVIPGHNDDEAAISRLVDFVAGLDRPVPLHFSAYHPAWKLQAPPTPRATLVRARALARQRLDWVYLGNVSGEDGRDSRCPACDALLVDRTDYRGASRLTATGACPGCHRPLPFVL